MDEDAVEHARCQQQLWQLEGNELVVVARSAVADYPQRGLPACTLDNLGDDDVCFVRSVGVTGAEVQACLVQKKNVW